MAVDLPDFWQSSVVNIITQDLPEVTSRPKYGAATRALYQTTLPINADTLLLTISGKGIIYCGFISLYLASISHAADIPTITVDGQALSTGDLGDFLTWGLFPYPSGVFTLSQYDNVNYNYTIVFANNITFETEVILKWFNNTADLCYLTACCIHAKI